MTALNPHLTYLTDLTHLTDQHFLRDSLKDGANTYRSARDFCCKNSLMPQTEVKHLLEKAFCEDDWDYLKQDPKFQAILKQYEGTVVEHYEYLVEVGGLLLQQRKDLNLE